MEYLPIIVNIILTFIFGVILHRVQKHLDATAEKEKEIQLALVEERWKIEDMRRANNKGTQALLRDRLLQGYHFFQRRGAVTYGEASSYQNMYEAYHALGKNGVMDGIFEEFQKIPIRPDAEVYPNEPTIRGQEQ